METRPEGSERTAAFVSVHHPCCSLSSVSQSGFTFRRCLDPSKATHCVARRQRVRATATPPQQDDPDDDKPKEEEARTDETSEKQPVEGIDDAEDQKASDLALPNLRELFAGAGKPGCEQCGGKGEIQCPVCEGKGFISLTMMDTTSSAQCRMCKGQRVIPCPTCRDMVYKSVLWWDQIPSKDEDPNEDWRQGPDGPRISWQDPPAGP